MTSSTPFTGWLALLNSLPALLILSSVVITPLQRFVRAQYRQPLNRTVCRQLAIVERIQGLRTPGLNSIMRLCAASVTVEFYITAMPVLYMLGHRDLTVLLVTCLAFSTYFGCALKDILCGLRPVHASRLRARLASQQQDAATGQPMAAHPAQASLNVRTLSVTSTTAPPLLVSVHSHSTSSDCVNSSSRAKELFTTLHPDQPLVVLEHSGDEIEYGAPSLHVLLALIINGCAASHMATTSPTYIAALRALHTANTTLHANTSHTLDQPVDLGHQALSPWTDPGSSRSSAIAAYAGTVAWTGWIVLNRLYLGVHSPVDCLLAAGVGLALLQSWMHVGPLWLAWMHGGGYWPCVLQCAAHVIALTLYPKPPQHTTSYRNAVTFLGAHMGICLGVADGTAPRTWALRLFHRVPNLLPRQAVPGALLATLDHPHTQVAHTLTVGLLLIGVVLGVGKAVLVALLPGLLGLAPNWLRRRWQPPVCTRYEQLDAPPIDWLLGIAAQDESRCNGGTMRPAGRIGAPGGGKALLAGIPAGSGHLDNGVAVHGGRAGDGETKAPGGGSTDVPDDGVLRKPNGFPWDADAVRRYVCYCLPVWVCVEYAHCRSTALS